MVYPIALYISVSMPSPLIASDQVHTQKRQGRLDHGAPNLNFFRSSSVDMCNEPKVRGGGRCERSGDRGK